MIFSVRIASRVCVLAVAAVSLLAAQVRAADAVSDQDKPRAAFFPLGGDADQQLRERVTFAFRQKLDRDGHYEVVDGFRMKEVAAEAKAPINFDTAGEVLTDLNRILEAKVLVWGDMDKANKLRVKIMDLREKDPQPRPMSGGIDKPTDLRFVSERILQTIPGVAVFEHPDEDSVKDDPLARQLWKSNPNLVKNGDFALPGMWSGIYESEYYPVEIKPSLPAVDKVCIYKHPGGDGEEAHNVLAMNLSRECAENNGMACLSEAIKIDSNTRYRIQFRYKSDGPVLHVFVKGYTAAQDIKDAQADREVYRRQVNPTGATHGKWETIVCDLNPQNIAWPVQTLKVDLYAYLTPGMVLFDDVQLRAVGSQTRRAHDDAIKPPVTMPAREKNQ